MLPRCKIYNRKTPNREGQLLVTNIKTTDPYRPHAVNEYIRRRHQEIKDLHAEIKRVTMGYMSDRI